MSPRWTREEIDVATRLARAVSAGDPPNQAPQPVLWDAKERSGEASQRQLGVLVMSHWVTDGKPIAYSAEPPFPWPEPLAIEGKWVVVDLGTTVVPFEVEVRVLATVDDAEPAPNVQMVSCMYERSRSRCRIHRQRDDETWKVTLDLPPEGGPSFLAVEGRWLLHPTSASREVVQTTFSFDAAWLSAVERPVLTGLRRWWSQRLDALTHPRPTPPPKEKISPDAVPPRLMRAAEQAPGTASLDGRVAALCSSPAGCAYLLVVEETELSPEMAADRIVATHAAAIALAEIDIWQGGYAEVVATALEHGPRLEGLARQILSQPAAARWFAPLDRNAQWAIGDPEREITPENLVTPTSPPSNWERYAQEPADAVYTSTVLGDTCSLLAALKHGAGDYHVDPLIG